ncbi:MAG: ubiquinol-cytochrome c reductase iron-sulfur subunit [Actinomycetota bacterium]
MSPALLIAIVVGATLVAWLAFMAYVSTGARARAAAEARASAPDRERVLVGAGPRRGAPVYERAQPARPRRRGEEDAASVTRRQFLNRAYLGAFTIGLANFGLASLDFLWPRLRGGLGAKITVNVPGVGDDADAIKQYLITTREPAFISDGRFYIMTFEGDIEKAKKVPGYRQANTVNAGFVALFRKCPHLGCSVPWCIPSKWFECPCHGSKYSISGEYRDGPAPRSLDRFRVEVVGGKIVVDTSTRIEIPRGVVTSQPQPEGEHCVEAAGE